MNKSPVVAVIDTSEAESRTILLEKVETPETFKVPSISVPPFPPSFNTTLPLLLKFA